MINNKNILVISDNYPSLSTPTVGMFVFQIAQQFSKTYKVNVICPKVLFKHEFNQKKLLSDKNNVVYPKYFSFTNTKIKLLTKIRDYSKQKTIIKAHNGHNIAKNKFMFIYTHFLWNAIASLPLKRKLNIPLFVAMGESNPNQYLSLMENPVKLNEIRAQISGFIVVSEKMKQFCIDKLKVSSSKVLLAPNGVDKSKFYPVSNNKHILKKLNLNDRKFTVSFIGSFFDRKGIHELLEAIDEIDDVQLICIGKGSLPKSDKIVFAGPLPHEQINSYLNASDIFVFPTKAEGSSNALLEAAACGLPIITSNIPEVKEQLGEDNALYINPDNPEDIKRKILQLMNSSKKRELFSKKSLKIADYYSIEKRAENILKWINQRI